MPKYWGKQIFSIGSLPEVGQKQKTERKRKKERRAKISNNYGQLRIANATSGGVRKAAWAKKERKRLNDGNNDGAHKAAWAKNCSRFYYYFKKGAFI